MFSKIVLGSYMYLPANEIEDIESLRDELTVTPRVGDGDDRVPVELYHETVKWFGVPLFHSISEAKQVIDQRVVSPVKMNFVGKLRPMQEEILEKFKRYVSHDITGFILEAPPGFGKCHGKGTEILMFDGSIKKVENIKPGDFLMGPDSKPREVLSCSVGNGKMFKISPIKGEPFTCNEDHVLSLQAGTGWKGKESWRRQKNKIFWKGRVINIPLNEYISSSGNFKRIMKLWRAGVSFPKKEVGIDPYFVGLYLGDGSRHHATLTLGDKDAKIVEYLKRWAESVSLNVREEDGQGCKEYHLVSKGYVSHKDAGWIQRWVEYLCPNGTREIPQEFLLNSRDIRLQVLAGLLDSDGYYHSGCYEILTKYKELADGIVFLCRSLGFGVSDKMSLKKGFGLSRQYRRIGISGRVNIIPCKLKRKRADSRKQVKDVLRTGFSVTSIGRGKYYGFTLSGDGLYLLKDFTVTHNTVMAINMMSILKQKTLVIVPRSNLIKQWQERLLTYSDLKRSDIGWVEGGKGEWREKKVVIGLVHSLVLDRFTSDFKKAFGCVIFDEVDRSVPPQTFAPAVAMFPAKYRIGMSAVLKRHDGLEIIFQKHLGQVYLKGGDEGRMKPVVLIQHFTPTSGFVYPGSSRMNRRGMIISRLAANPVRTDLVANYVRLIWKSDRRCLVLSDRKIQLTNIYGRLSHRGVPAKDMGYYMRSLVGNKPVTERERRRIASDCKIILATYQMIQLGSDIPDLAGLVYATPQSHVLQAQGRIERALEGKKNPVVVDIVDTAYNDTLRWGVQRKRWYRSQGIEMKVV